MAWQENDIYVIKPKMDILSFILGAFVLNLR